MASNRVKVVGYSQQLGYGNGIEYRAFSPDILAPNMVTNDSSTSVFTMGNFAITANFEQKIDKTFVTNKFSNFITLNDFNVTLAQAEKLLTNNAGVILNLDKTKLSNYALFNSFSEFTRVALENIITNFPAALFVTPLYQPTLSSNTLSGFTFQNYLYDTLTNQSTFSVNTYVVNNKYQINYLQNGTIANTFNSTNDMRNLTANYSSYVILVNNVEYPIIDFTASTTLTNSYLYFNVTGDPFSGSTNGYANYYIKPNKINENLFFNGLPDFEYYLLNRQSLPIYTSTFNFTTKSDDGSIVYYTESITWPTTDGYNLDFDSDTYTTYANKLLDISTNFDETTSNLITRFLVSDSLTQFDTSDVFLDPQNEDNTDQKVNKLLTIYGVGFDDLNRYINGISFANVVTYNKQDNIPDIYIKNLARVLGWELISSVLEQDLLGNYITPKSSTYAGQSVGLTLVEADIELWRRIILNTPWLWKSKGTRKAIEFLFKFIGVPDGLIQFNEYVYVAQNVIDINEFNEILSTNGFSSDLTTYPLDSNGYPNPLPNTPDLYFQSKGLWYRETGGQNATLDITSGNNPHVGPYDGGYEYINQFRKLIPNFSGVTLSSETTTTTSINLFTNYNFGQFDYYSGSTYIDVYDGANTDITNNTKIEIIDDPYNRLDEGCFGCKKNGSPKSLSILIPPVNQLTACWYNFLMEPDYLCVFLQQLTPNDQLIFTIPSFIVNGKELITSNPPSSGDIKNSINWIPAFNGVVPCSPCPSNIDCSHGRVYTNFTDFLNVTFSGFGLNYTAQPSLINRMLQNPLGGSSDISTLYGQNNGFGFYIIRPVGDTFTLFIECSVIGRDLFYTEKDNPGIWSYDVNNNINTDKNYNDPGGVSGRYYLIQCKNNQLVNGVVQEVPKIILNG
jgi:hypothetical protein